MLFLHYSQLLNSTTWQLTAQTCWRVLMLLPYVQGAKARLYFFGKFSSAPKNPHDELIRNARNPNSYPQTNSKTNLNATTTGNPTPWHKQWEQTHDFQFHTIWPDSTQKDINTPQAQIQPKEHSAPHTPPVRKTTHKARFTRPTANWSGQTKATKPNQTKPNQPNQTKMNRA